MASVKRVVLWPVPRRRWSDVEQEIDHLWRHSMTAEDPGVSERLAELSHALQRAARLLEHDRAIG